jgi:peptide chain release factor 1
MADYLDRISQAEDRSRELETQLSDPELARQPGRYQKLGKELGKLRPLLDTGRRYRDLLGQLEDSKAMLDDDDSEMVELARSEIETLGSQIQEIEGQLFELLIPRDPNDEKNAIFEIRAGTGGDEAALFAADLFRMYARHAEGCGWKIETLSSSASASGGFKEIIAMIDGEGVFSRLKWERGVHRVQRVPVTESQGRIHTSTVTVAVMPEAEEVDVRIDPQDLRIDVMRAGGPGGQSVNTTDSAVRITHVPSGVVVAMQDERSQLQNKARAMQVLRARLYELAEAERETELSAERRSQVGGGGRSEKIRTYNYKENRVTDHRIGFTVYRLTDVLAGALQIVVDALASEERARLLAEGEPSR